jgi:predicted Zn finger-like uncharacterized protein
VPFTVTCPNCDTELTIPDDTLGKRIRCSKCREAFTASVESLSDGGPSAVATAVRTGLLVGGLAGVAALGVFAIVLMIRLKANSEPLRHAAGSVGDFFASTAALWLVLLVLAFVVGYVALVIGTMAWVARDADSRGHVGVLWAVVFITPHLAITPVALPLVPVFGIGLPLMLVGWVGLVVYHSGRRPGRLVPCKDCPNRRLDYAAHCPHCGR